MSRLSMPFLCTTLLVPGVMTSCLAGSEAQLASRTAYASIEPLEVVTIPVRPVAPEADVELKAAPATAEAAPLVSGIQPPRFDDAAVMQAASSRSAGEGRAVVGHASMPWEVTIAAAGVTGEDWDAGGANAAVDIGYYFDDNFSLAFRQNGSFSDAGRGRSDVWNGTSRIAADLHFPMGRIVPFVGVNGGVVYGDLVEESVIVGPEAGVRLYLKDDVFLRALVEYQFFLDKSDKIENAFDDGQFVLGIGFGIRF